MKKIRTGLLTVALALIGSTAWAYMKFGYDGRDGRDGYDGMHGVNGISQTVMATGQPQFLDLSGRDGGRGYDGENGQDAMGCFFSQGPQDMLGADGGNAGRGGRGGNGGNSGLLTVAYDDVANLKLIQVRAMPGLGGPAGRPGYPGRGCRCPYYSWQITQNGHTQTYHCQSGRDGTQWGLSGGNGLPGLQMGTLLIPQTAPIPAENPKRMVAFTDLLTGPFELSKNQWSTVSGVRDLFAAGSVMSDVGGMYQGLLKLRYAFAWQAVRPMAEFAASQMTLNLPKTKIELALPADVWMDGTETVSGDLTTYTVTSALYEKDAANLAWGGSSGSGTVLSVILADASGVSDLVGTSVEITYSTTAGAFGYQIRYSGTVPTSAIGISKNAVIVNIGALGIMPTYLRPGTYAMVDLKVTRRLGARAKTVTFNKTFRI